jgi:hypothetical protein
MGDFQLIVLEEANRPARKARESGAFSLIQFAEYARAGMGSSAVPDSLAEPDAAAWYSPIEACAYASLCVGAQGASKAIWQLLMAGMIEAVAATSSMTPRNRAPKTDTKPSLIPKRLWRSISDTGTDLWSGAYARFWVTDSDGGTTYQFFGIKLKASDVHSNLPSQRPDLVAAALSPPSAAAGGPTSTAEAANKGGRPRKEWWDDFWIEICRQIWIGDLQPTTQADLERAMIEWVENHRNGEVGETTIKAAAKKLFKAWSLGSKT